MGAVTSPIRALPNPRVTRTYGIINIVFASLLLIGGLCYSVYMAFLPTLMKAMGQAQATIKVQVEKGKAQKLENIEERAKAATTEKEKAQIAAEKTKVEAAPGVPMMAMPDLEKMGLNDFKLQVWAWGELVTGLIANVMLLASGIGLLSCKPWSWRLGMWTAIFKIARLAVLYGIFVVVIVPPLARNMGNVVVEMMAQQQAAMGAPAGNMPTAELFIKVYSVMYSVMGVGFFLFGSIYPLILIWGLTRPGVRSACLAFTAKRPAVETGLGELP